MVTTIITGAICLFAGVILGMFVGDVVEHHYKNRRGRRK